MPAVRSSVAGSAAGSTSPGLVVAADTELEPSEGQDDVVVAVTLAELDFATSQKGRPEPYQHLEVAAPPFAG